MNPRVEAAAYFCVAEIVADLSPPVEVVLSPAEDRLRIVITGGTQGSLPTDSLTDRVETVAGSVRIRTTASSTVVELSRSPTENCDIRQ